MMFKGVSFMWPIGLFFSPDLTVAQEVVLAKSQKKVTLQLPFCWSDKPVSSTLVTMPAILLLENLQKSLSMSFEVRIFTIFKISSFNKDFKKLRFNYFLIQLFVDYCLIKLTICSILKEERASLSVVPCLQCLPRHQVS